MTPDSTFYKIRSDIILLCQGFVASDARMNNFPEDTPEGLQYPYGGRVDRKTMFSW